MARRLRQPSAGASTVEDLVQTGGRQRLTAPWSFQHHEHPIGPHLRPLLIQIVPKRGEEPRRHRHHPLPTALALGHKYPPLAGACGGIAVGQVDDALAPGHFPAGRTTTASRERRVSWAWGLPSHTAARRTPLGPPTRHSKLAASLALTSRGWAIRR